MKHFRRGFAGTSLAVLTVAACGSRVTNNVTVFCDSAAANGAGCSSIAGGTSGGTSGNGGCRGARCGGIGGSEAVAGSPDGDAGLSNVGAAGSDDDNVGGAGDAGDAGASSVAGGAGAGSGGGPGTPIVSHWLAFTHTDGTFVYDLSKFPSADAAIQLGSGVPLDFVHWSPDGRTLLYSDAHEWYSVDMNGNAPGTPIDIGAGLGDNTWSADSRSIATSELIGTTLRVFDPTRTKSPMSVITTSLKAFKWAPAGHLMLYSDATGSYVVSVVNGVPGTPKPVSATAAVWAPNGLALAGVEGGNLTLTDVSGETPAVAALRFATVDSPIAAGASFSKDGAKIAFNGVQERNASDVYVVDAAGPLSHVFRPYLAPPDLDHHGSAKGWSAEGRWLMFTTEVSNVPLSAITYGVDLSGDSPGTPIPIPTVAGDSASWFPTGQRILIKNNMQNGQLVKLSMFDFHSPATPPLGLFDAPQVQFGEPRFNSTGDVLSIASSKDMYWIDLASPAAPTTKISLEGDLATIGKWEWSAEGQFVAVVDYITDHSLHSYQLELLHAVGITPSVSLTIKAPSKDSIVFRWQPVMTKN